MRTLGNGVVQAARHKFVYGNSESITEKRHTGRFKKTKLVRTNKKVQSDDQILHSAEKDAVLRLYAADISSGGDIRKIDGRAERGCLPIYHKEN